MHRPPYSQSCSFRCVWLTAEESDEFYLMGLIGMSRPFTYTNMA